MGRETSPPARHRPAGSGRAYALPRTPKDILPIALFAHAYDSRPPLHQPAAQPACKLAVWFRRSRLQPSSRQFRRRYLKVSLAAGVLQGLRRPGVNRVFE